MRAVKLDFGSKLSEAKPSGHYAKILLLAAQLDILLEPIWIPGHINILNILADALSQFNLVQIANLCPHWQPYLSNHLPLSTNGSGQSHT